jgi:hypothetical protein
METWQKNQMHVIGGAEERSECSKANTEKVTSRDFPKVMRATGQEV